MYEMNVPLKSASRLDAQREQKVTKQKERAYGERNGERNEEQNKEQSKSGLKNKLTSKLMSQSRSA
jgi:hypothetical protein